MPARMRGLKEAHAYLLLNDPDCSLTLTALRRLVVTGKIPCVRIGQKYLLNLDTLDQYLQGSLVYNVDQGYGGISPVVLRRAQ